VLIKFTYIGDANLNGVIEQTDYDLLQSGDEFNRSGYQNGDFNYDEVIDQNDYDLIDNSFSNQGPPL